MHPDLSLLIILSARTRSASHLLWKTADPQDQKRFRSNSLLKNRLFRLRGLARKNTKKAAAKRITTMDTKTTAAKRSTTTTDTTTQLLDPEYNNSFELGANLRYNYVSDYIRSVNINAALFSGSVYNKILKRPFADYIVQSQIGRNTTKGIEASVKFEGILKYLNFTASYIKLDIENRLLYEYKDDMVFMGGVNIRKMMPIEASIERLKEKINLLKESGSYIYHADSPIMPEVSFHEYNLIIDSVKESGKY